MATLIKQDGTELPVEPKNGKHFKLKELQSMVGGTIDILSTPTEVLFIVHDEGKFLFGRNEKASQQWYAQYAGHDVDFMGDFLAGDVLVCHTDQVT